MENERLKAELIELDWIRAREARLSRDSSILLHALARVQRSQRPESAIRSILDGLRDDLVCDLAAMVEFDADKGTARVLLSSRRETEGVLWRPGRAIFDKSRCFASLDPARTGLQLPPAFSHLNAMICIPTKQIGSVQEALLCFSVDPGIFSSDHRILLERIASLMSQQAETLRLARRNAALTAVLQRSQADTAAIPDPPLSETSDAEPDTAARLTQAHTIIIEALIDLLDKPAGESSARIQDTLAQLGDALNLDGICLLSGDGDGAVAPKFQWLSTFGKRRLMPPQEIQLKDLLAQNPSLLSGEAVRIEDCRLLHPGGSLSALFAEGSVLSALLVPLLEQGAVTGVAMFKSARSMRIFTDAEAYMLQAFANLIASVAAKLKTEADLRAAREKLQFERNRLDAILLAMPDLVFQIGPEGRVDSIYSNSVWELVSKPETLVGRDPITFLTPDVHQVYLDMRAELDRSGITHSREVQVLVRGLSCWYDLSAAICLPAQSDTQHAYVFVVRDITEERARRVEVEQLSLIARRTSNLVVLADPEGRIFWVNSAFERRTGYLLNEVKGRHPGSFLQGPETDPKAIELMRAKLGAGEGVQLQIKNYDRNGQAYWVDMDIQPTRNAAGDITGFMSVQADISSQKQQIADLEKSERQARAELIAAMDASRDAIAITNPSGYYIYMNRAHRELFGFSLDADLSSISWRALYRQDIIEEIEQSIFPVLRANDSWQGELMGYSQAGKPIMQGITLTLQENGGILCISRDIGQRIAAEAERSRLGEILQRAQRQQAISQLATGLAHDLNNLIASIAGSAVLIQDQSDLAAAPHAARILMAAERASELMQRVLDQGTQREKKELVDIRSLLEELADLVKSSLPRKMQLTIRCDDEGVKLEADPTDILQIILNLVINARDAMPDSKENPLIEISSYTATPRDLLPRPQSGFLDPRQSYYVFEVSDNGSGMTEDVSERIFEPYFTTKGKRGTGLGLMIVASIMEANGGAVSVQTEVGVGTRVLIFWPIQTAARLDAEKSEPNARLGRKLPATSALDLGAFRILLVDDNMAFLEVLTAILESSGANITPFSNPVDALHAFQQNPSMWDVLITDFDMPEMNGSELAFNFKQLHPNIKVILVTALADWRSRLSIGRQKDFVAVIQKPGRPGQLVAQVSDILLEGRA